ETAWVSSAVYTGGQQVAYNGHLYTAKWWTQGDTPGQGGEWGVWTDNGSCTPGDGDGDDGTENPGDGDNGDGDNGSEEPGDGDNGDGDDPEPQNPAEPGQYIAGYYTDWGVYDQNYHVKNIETSGSAD